jgi:plastocyanin
MRWLIVAVLLAAPPPDKRPARDRAMLQLIERETQIANLLTAGRLAWDAGDYAAAAAKWEALLKIEGLTADVEKAVKPFAAEARSRAAGGTPLLPVPLGEVEAKPEAPKEPPRPQPVTVSGTISGGGSVGPGGAVITLKRLEGWTPRAQPLNRPMLEKEKRFVPHVLAVPLGSTVDFRNEDEIFHNVFSLSPAAKFDTGLHKGGADTPVKFDKAGVIELLCNIHATMLGYLVVVDTPWYAVADGGGAFQIRGVPPGEYEAAVWHESANEVQKRKVTVEEGAQLAFTVASDKRANPFPPDKYGKPRQQQLGY